MKINEIFPGPPFKITFSQDLKQINTNPNNSINGLFVFFGIGIVALAIYVIYDKMNEDIL